MIEKLDPMQEAASEAENGVKSGHGGPFGAVIVKDGKIIGRGHNSVILKNDPTSHAEVEAIRDACRRTGSFDLSGTVLYTTCYPCPMCLGAIMWARIDRIYYCLNSEDVAKIGFDDGAFYDNFSNPEFLDGFAHVSDQERERCIEILKSYSSNEHTIY